MGILSFGVGAGGARTRGNRNDDWRSANARYLGAFRQTDEVAQQGHARIRALLGVELNAEGDRARLHDAREILHSVRTR